MTDSIRAVLTDPDAPGHVKLQTTAQREPGPGQSVIRVRAFSLNRGELGFAGRKPVGSTIGWDVAGELEDGSRVVAFCRAMDGWAEEVVVPDDAFAPIPDGVSFRTAAALPVAAGTALASVDEAKGLLGRRALITGVTGGVGGFAVQLAKLAGAHVTAQVRKAEQIEYARTMGADEVVVTSDGAALDSHGPFRLFVDGVGGKLLAAGLGTLEKDGVAVSYGQTGSPEVALPVGLLLGKGRARLRGLNLYAVSEVEAPSVWLGRLLQLVADGRLQVDMVDRGSWTDVSKTADDLMQRRFRGKAVLTVD